MSWTGVITDAGRALLEQWSTGGQTLTIERAEVGSGLRAESALRSATAPASPESSAQIVSSRAVQDGTQIKLLIGPAADEAYTAREIGLWARLGSGSSVLLALHQDSAGGVSIPTEEASPNFAFTIVLIHAIDNDESLSVTTDPEVYVTEGELEERLDEVSAALRFPSGFAPTGAIRLTRGVHYFDSMDELPAPGTPGRVVFVKV